MFCLEFLIGGGLLCVDILDMECVVKLEGMLVFGISWYGMWFWCLCYFNDIIIVVEEIWFDGDVGFVKWDFFLDLFY